jgi:hypothetical protein
VFCAGFIVISSKSFLFRDATGHVAITLIKPYTLPPDINLSVYH